MGWRNISGSGAVCSHHPPQRRASSRSTHRRNRLSVWLLQLLPSTIYTRAKVWFSEWFLLELVVLQRQKKNWEEEFDNEKNIYRILAPVQGVHVPMCYGEARCPATETTGTRALVLSDVGGISLDEDGAKGFSVEEFETLLREPIRAIAELRVAHDDLKLANYHLVDNKIVVIDFDSSYVSEDEDPEWITRSNVKPVSRLYNNVHRGGARMPWR